MRQVAGLPGNVYALSVYVPDLATLVKNNPDLKNFSQQTIVTAGHQVGSYNVPWQGTVAVTAKKTINELSWSGQPVTLPHTAHTIKDTGPAG